MRIAVLIGGIVYEAQNRLVKGIMKYADENDVSIHVFSSVSDAYKQSEYGIGEMQIYQLPDFARYDGAIFVKGTIQNDLVSGEIIQKIRDSKISAISIESNVSGMPVFYTDNENVMYSMVSHLIEVHGVKNICYLSGPKQSRGSIERLAGAMEAIKEHGLKFDDENIYYGDYLSESGRKFVRDYMKSGKKLPEAIVCANDFMALGVYTELDKYGIKVGKDILMTGYDHFSDTANLVPAITTIEKPQMEIGYEACKSLVENKMIEDRKFKAKCYYKGSCGCPEHRTYDISKIQLQHAQAKLEADYMMEMSKNMVSDLNNCDDLSEFCECLKTFIVQTDFSFVYLCLCEEDIIEEKIEYGYDYKTRVDYSERAYVPIAYEEGEFTKYPYFLTKELLPKECLEKIDNKVCFIAPLHFRKNCLGYLVVCGSELPYKSMVFYNWLTNISGALENINRQNELKQLVKRLSNVWMMDSLTQVYNRAGFFHYADRIVKECQRENVPIGILFVDINKLKRVNDDYGHEEGDFYIKSVAEHMRRLKSEEQLLMRYGGDEFVVLGKLINGNEFTGLLEELNPKLEECGKCHEKVYELSVSMGFQSVVITKDFKLDRLMEQADREMYKMKKKDRHM